MNTPKVIMRNLSVLSYANGFTLWHYRDKQNVMADIVKMDYWDDAATMFGDDDVIIITAFDNDTAQYVAVKQNWTHIDGSPFPRLFLKKM